MAVLHNRISNAELETANAGRNRKRITVSFYEYFYLSDPKAFRDELYKHLYQLKVFGRIYVASEGHQCAGKRACLQF